MVNFKLACSRLQDGWAWVRLRKVEQKPHGGWAEMEKWSL